jgi:hypothetical protein
MQYPMVCMFSAATSKSRLLSPSPPPIQTVLRFCPGPFPLALDTTGAIKALCDMITLRTLGYILLLKDGATPI